MKVQIMSDLHLDARRRRCGSEPPESDAPRGRPAVLDARANRNHFLAHSRTSDRASAPGNEADPDVLRDVVQAYCCSTDKRLYHPGIDRMAGAHTAEK
jgi:hypothetical protein